MDHLDALDLATTEFQHRVDAVTDDNLASATPCEEWDVRFLVAHVVGGNRFASLVLDGETSAVAIDRIMSTGPARTQTEPGLRSVLLSEPTRP